MNIKTSLLYIFLACGAAFQAHAAPPDGVPFRGRLEGKSEITPLTPPYLFAYVQASGNANELGLFTLEMPHIVNFPPNSTTATAIGSFTLRAANGDTLTGDFVGTAFTTGTQVSITEIAIVKGGTGRFAGAIGTFTMNRALDLADPNGSTVGSIEGRITAPGLRN